jgi:hypothetical protein
MRPTLLALATAVLLSGCYRVTVTTGAPAAPTTIDIPWQHSFVYGLVPPQELSTAERCPNNVSKVVTEQSFLNGLASALTWSLYTPIHVTVTCASGPVRQ